MSMKIKLPAPEYDVAELKALIAAAEAVAEPPQPVEGQEYVQRDRPPGNTKGNVYRFWRGQWEFNWANSDTERSWGEAWTAADHWRSGRLVPYVPPPPTFKVGEWVIGVKGTEWLWPKALKVVHVDEYVWTAERGSGGWWYAHNLRHATPEEIAAATRIEPKVGMLLKRKSDGAVLRVWKGESNTYPYLDRLDISTHSARPFSADLSTEDYEVLKNYLIEGSEP